jgi:hypothetical protein
MRVIAARRREEPLDDSSWNQADLARESPAATAAHAAESRIALAQDAAVTATMLQNLGPLLTALRPTKDAAIRVGALLIIKVDWIVSVHQLTAAQQHELDHRPELATSPHCSCAIKRMACSPRAPSPPEPAKPQVADLRQVLARYRPRNLDFGDDA